MPLHATNVVDPAGDLLVYAHRGAVTIVRGLRAGPRTIQRVELPPWARIYSLHLLDGVVYVGATGSASMLGFVDTRGEPRWQRIEVPRHHIAPQKGIDGFARRGPCLIAVDDVVMPRYFLFLDVSDPRSPALVEVRDLDGYIRDERVVGVAGKGSVMAVLSGTNAGSGRVDRAARAADAGQARVAVPLGAQPEPRAPAGPQQPVVRRGDGRRLAVHRRR